MADFHHQINEDSFYHIYSRANGQEKLFKNQENFRFFLEKFNLHLNPVIDTFAWCLLPNHFHFLVKSKPFAEIQTHYTKVKGKSELLPDLLPEFMMERFSNWLNSYTKAFNKVYSRKGSLFIDFMRRVPVLTDEQFLATIFYIHNNPVHHGLVLMIEDWEWSSYKSFFNKAETELQRAEVLRRFQGIDEFESYHKQSIFLKDAVLAEDV